MMTKRNFMIMAGLLALTLLISAISIGSGRYPIGIGDFFRLVTGSRGNMPESEFLVMRELLFSNRLPRLLAGLLVGMSLSMSGTTFQAMFRNPLISPELLGVMGGALCGLTVGFMLDLNMVAIQLLAFVGGLIAVAVTVSLSRAYRGDRLLILVLSGIITGAMFLVAFKLLEYFIDQEKVIPNLMPWAIGSLGLATGRDLLVTLPLFAVGIAVMLLCGKSLNVLSLGEEAATLGLNPEQLRLLAILGATLVSSLTVTLAGIVAWIGLVVPHLGRLLVGHDNRVLLPVSALIGAPLLVLADDLSRCVTIRELPLGITMSFIGIPVFLLLLFQTRKSAVLI